LHAEVIRGSCFSSGLIPHTTVNKHSLRNLRRYTAATTIPPVTVNKKNGVTVTPCITA